MIFKGTHIKNCSAHLLYAGIDKCNPEHQAWTVYDEDCCTTTSPCGEKQGGCTSDDQCGGTLLCSGSQSSCGSEFDISSGEKCCHVQGQNSIMHLRSIKCLITNNEYNLENNMVK